MARTAKAVVTAMEGRGFYNRNSAMQAASNAVLLPLWREAAGRVPPGDQHLTIGDYGPSHGRNAMEPMTVAIDALRQRAGPGRAIEIVHTDLPANDYSALFQAVGEDAASYRRGDDAVFFSAIGRSYFEQILPAG